MIAAYQDPDHQHGRTLVSTLITALTTRVPKPLTELITLGGALDKQAADMLAYFERPAPATAPPKRLTAPSSTSETAPSACATARPLLKASGFKPQRHPRLRSAALASSCTRTPADGY